jgi:hypothetical protein
MKIVMSVIKSVRRQVSQYMGAIVSQFVLITKYEKK